MSERAGRVLGVALTADVLTAIWADLQRAHPDLPDARFELSTSARTSGHSNVDFAARPVQLVIGAAMARRPPAVILEWLLHEAAHSLAEARSGPPTPAQRKRGFHTNAFRDAALELGLEASYDPGFGWRDTALPPALVLLGRAWVRLALTSAEVY